MSQRIRYIKATDESMMGNQYYKNAEGKEFQISFVTGSPVQGSVVEVATGVTVASPTATSPHKIKIALKRELQKLGCEFSVEKREKKVDEGN